MWSVCKSYILIETGDKNQPCWLLPSFPWHKSPQDTPVGLIPWEWGGPLRMAPMEPTLLDEAPLLPRLLLRELYLLEQSIQVHSWLLGEPVGSVGRALCEGSRRVPTALPSGLCPGLGLHGLGTEAWGHG